MKHTPGPWIMADGHASTWAIYAALDIHPGTIVRTGVPICDIQRADNDDNGLPVDEANANARLISAAPDLLAALQSIATTAGLCAITFPNAPGNGDLQAIVRDARAAIAKATNN